MLSTSKRSHPDFACVIHNQDTVLFTMPRLRLRPGLARALGRIQLALLLLLGPGTSAGLAQDLLPEPVHLAVTSAKSAELRVDLSSPMTHAFSSSAKWKGYLEFLGKPGTARSLGQPDLFLPLLQDPNDMTFLNIRGQLQFDNTDNNETNIGLGHRHMFEEWILGGHGYYDRRNTQYGSHINQFTGGLEAMSVDWAFRLNGYLPENQTTTFTGDANVSVITPGDQIKVQVDGIVQEKALPGLDGEVGYLLPIPWNAYTAVFDETRVYAGGYHFFGEDQFDSVTGPRGRLELRSYDLPGLGPGSRFMMGVEAQWDEPRGSQAFGLFSLRIPFDVFADKSQRKALKGLDRRMLQPVIRDVDVVTSQFDVPTETLPALNQAGQVYTKLVEVDVTNQADVQAAIDANTDATTLIIPKKNGEMIALDDSGPLTLNSSQTLGGGAGTVEFDSRWLGAGSVGYTPSGAVAGFTGTGSMCNGNDTHGAMATDTMITMAADSEVNGLTLDANEMCGRALMVKTFSPGTDAPGTRWVANMNLMNSTGDVIVAHGLGAEFRIDNSRITGSTGDGSNGAGVEAKRGGTVYISNSYVANNGGHGLHADGDAGIGATIIADNLVIENNNFGPEFTAGVASNGGSLIHITNSVVRNNFDGLLADNPGSRLIADNVDIIGSMNGGFGVFAVDHGSVTIENSRITGNTIGLETFSGSGTTAHIRADNLTITGNGIGVKSAAGAEINITESIISNNVSHGLFAHDDETGVLGLVNATNVTITGNGGYGALSAGGAITLSDSVVFDGRLGDFENLTIGSSYYDLADEACEVVGVQGFLNVDGTEVPATPGVCP